MRAYSRLLLQVAVMVGVTVPPAVAAKTAFRYEAAQRVIKACVLYIEQPPPEPPGTFVNSNPYLIEGLRRSDLCPDDWEFENPLAEPAAASTRPGVYVVKGNPSYWRVELTDDTAPQLVGFDLIYVCAPVVDLPSEIQRDGLVKAVENGALLWVDNAIDRSVDPPTGTTMREFAPPYSNTPPSPPFDFITGGENPGNWRVALDATHGILREPFKLSSRLVRALGDLPDSTATGTTGDPTDDYLDPTALPRDVFGTVVQVEDSSGDRWPNIVAGPFGSGSMVLTASAVGADVAGWILDGRSTPSRQQAPDVKLALNMIQWTDRWEQARRQPRGGATSVARAPFPLDIAWQYPGPTEAMPALNIGQVVCSPVYGRGMVYAVSLTSGAATPAMLMCFDVDPKQDLDGNGYAGDGVNDYSQGTPYDMIWRADLSADVLPNASPRFSSPTLATISVDNGSFDVPVQVVLVSVVDTADGTGSVACYNATLDPDLLAALPGGYPTTGEVIWTYNVLGWDEDPLVPPPPAEIVCLSTPIVHRGHVYVLASEYDPVRLAPGVEGTYGRAHCFELNYDWSSGVAGSQWVYPSPDDDLSGDGTPHQAEHQRSLPAFNEPEWIAQGPGRRDLPYVRGAIPVVASVADRVDGISVDALLTFGTPVTHEFSGGNVQIAGWTSWTDRDGGSEFALIPSPRNGAGTVMLNEQYYRVRLNNAETNGNPDDTINATVRADDNTIAVAATAVTWKGDRYAVYDPGAVREALAELSTTGGIDDPIQLQTGAEVLVTYTYDGNQIPPNPGDPGEPHWLPGPVRWRHEFGALRCDTCGVRYNAEQWSPGDACPRAGCGGTLEWQPEARVCDAAAGVSDIVASTEVPVDNATPPNTAASSAKVFCLDGNTGRPKWSYDPKHRAPILTADLADYKIQATTAPAFDGDTAVVGATCVDTAAPPGTPAATSAVVGLRRETDAVVRLRGDAGTLDSFGVAISESRAFVVTLEATGDFIDPTCYRVDRVGRYLIFPADKAANVMDTGGASLGPIYGQAIEVEWWDDRGTPADPDDESPLWNPDLGHHGPGLHGESGLYVVPALERFFHIAGHIKLHYYPVDWSVGNEPIITLLDGTPVTGFDAVNHLDPMDPTSPCVDGWIDMTSATAPPGTEVLVSYAGFSEQNVGHPVADPDGDGFIQVPNAALNLPAERHQIPIEFGPSASAPALAGTTIHLGTEGFDGDLDGAFDDPDGAGVGGGVADTLLSLIWDKATGFVRSALSQPSEHDVTYDAPNPTIGIVSSAPTVAEDRVFVGSRLMTTPGTGTRFGFVSAMAPRRLLICDNTRLIETTGSEPSWVCTATLSPQRGQSFVGEDFRRPFSRPAKATRLPNGNMLVVDSGNNRVVEIDESGRVIWPLDPYGYEYYTSPDNHNLRLSRPADAHRYMVLLPTGRFYHTVIADTGNARVIDVVTTVTGGVQDHEVYVKTPSRVRLSTEPKRYASIRYTSAQPIFDPGNNVCVGYVCAAANLNQVMVVENGSRVINPQAGAFTPAGNGSTWAYWAWLYDGDLSDGSDVADNPLLFDNIKHVEYTRYGGTLYLTVTCSRYRGRAKAGSPHSLAQYGPGVFEFRIDVSGAPGSWQLQAPAGGSDEPYWHFVGGTGDSTDNVPYGYWYEVDGPDVDTDPDRRPITHITTATGTYRKRWYPVCAKRLVSGRHLIVNSISALEHATPGNIGDTSAALGSHIFQLETSNADENNPYNDTYDIPGSRSVPEPGKPAWADPFNQPTYAELL